MKSFRSFLIGIFLALLVAGGTWLDAHAPSVNNDEVFFVMPTETPHKVKNMNTRENPVIPLEAVNSQSIASMTEPPKGSGNSIKVGTETPSLPTQVASCSDGPVGSGIFVWPTDNHALTGNDYGPGHPGLDLAAGEGSPVYAADAGVVIALGDDKGGYGNMIAIDHHNGFLTLYAHLSVIEVNMCQGVEAGQRIGAAGSTGNAQGAHLHFGVEQDGLAIDPWTVLP